MSRQIINNTNINPDNLKVSFDKVNSNFEELYSATSGQTSAVTITKTSELINDGADGVNPFINANDLPPFVKFNITDIELLPQTLSNLGNDNAALYDEVQTLNQTVTEILTIINTQNQQIATMQGQIADLYNIINNL